MNYWAPNGVERLHKGAFVEVSNCQFRTESYEKEGKTVYTSYFHAVEVKVLNIAQADSSAPAQAPATAPATASAPASAPVTASVPATVQASAIAEAVVKMPWD